MPDTTLTAKSVRIAEDEAKWLTTAASRGGVTQNDLLRLGLNRLRKELGAASRVKPEAVVATAKASRYKLTPPRTAATATTAATAVATPARATDTTSRNGKRTQPKSAGRGRAGRGRTGRSRAARA